MYLRRDDCKRTARAPAKLNLFLEVLGRRDDGFHEVETLMVPVRLGDWLTMTPTPPQPKGAPGSIVLDLRVCLPVRPPPQSQEIPAGSDNLVVRALELLRQRSGCQWGARIELLKRVPAAAGLGGGSSDAATALRLANRAWRLDWPRARLAELAAELGSDVPFFLSGGAAICRGRGERVERLPPVSPLDFVIVQPPDGLSTADVYRAYDMLKRTPPSVESGRLKHVTRTIAGLCRRNLDWMRNALQTAAASLSPWVERMRTAFEQLDFLAHQLSGSGLAYFGICRHARHARRLASILGTWQLGHVYVTRSCK
jgi:4-diphosphocytidyl-2-C-methyl-D-erythritol kinase